MSVYLIILYDLADLSLRQAAGHIKNALLLLSTVGLFNLFFDTSVVLTIGGHSLSGGVVSLAVLLLKGLFSMLSVYLLIAVTGMESLCAALDRLHMPSILTTTLLLIYRYLILLLQGRDILFLCLSSAYFFICRIFPVFEYIGGIFRNIT